MDGATAPMRSCSHDNCFMTSATWLIGNGITTWADQGPCVACQDSAEPSSCRMVNGAPYSRSYSRFQLLGGRGSATIADEIERRPFSGRLGSLFANSHTETPCSRSAVLTWSPYSQLANRAIDDFPAFRALRRSSRSSSSRFRRRRFLRGYLDQLIVSDIFQGEFKRHFAWRREDQGFIGCRRPACWRDAFPCTHSHRGLRLGCFGRRPFRGRPRLRGR